jgi:hypothetical protein
MNPLAHNSSLSIKIANDADVLEGRQVYVTPPSKIFLLQRGKLSGHRRLMQFY